MKLKILPTAALKYLRKNAFETSLETDKKRKKIDTSSEHESITSHKKISATTTTAWRVYQGENNLSSYVEEMRKKEREKIVEVRSN